MPAGALHAAQITYAKGFYDVATGTFSSGGPVQNVVPIALPYFNSAMGALTDARFAIAAHATIHEHAEWAPVTALTGFQAIASIESNYDLQGDPKKLQDDSGNVPGGYYDNQIGVDLLLGHDYNSGSEQAFVGTGNIALASADCWADAAGPDAGAGTGYSSAEVDGTDLFHGYGARVTYTYTPSGTGNGGSFGIGLNVGDNDTYTHDCTDMTLTGDLTVGDAGTGTFNQSCGNILVGGSTYLGKSATGNGTYNLSGGTLQTDSDLVVGGSGVGAFNQTGGTNTVNGTLYVAANGGSTGTYALGSGTLITGGDLDVGGAGSHGSLNQTGGTLMPFGAITVEPGSAYNFSGGTLSATYMGAFTNHGTFTVSGGATANNLHAIEGMGSTTVAASASLTAGHINQGGLTVNGNVQIAQNGSSTGVSRVYALAIGSNGQLDLKNNHLIVTASGSTGTWDGSKYTGVQGLVASGRDSANWDGPGIITSMPDAQASNYTTLGVILASTRFGNQTGTWAGQTVNPTDTLAMYTYGGDANLDGLINVDDYGAIDSHNGQTGVGWRYGDFNYDGIVNINDYGIIDGNAGNQGDPFPGVVLGGVSTVPVPASGMLLMAGAGLLTRRRRRNSQ